MWVEFPKGVWMERNGVLVSGFELTESQCHSLAANIWGALASSLGARQGGTIPVTKETTNADTPTTPSPV